MGKLSLTVKFGKIINNGNDKIIDLDKVKMANLDTKYEN